MTFKNHEEYIQKYWPNATPRVKTLIKFVWQASRNATIDECAGTCERVLGFVEGNSCAKAIRQLKDK